MARHGAQHRVLRGASAIGLAVCLAITACTAPDDGGRLGPLDGVFIGGEEHSQRPTYAFVVLGDLRNDKNAQSILRAARLLASEAPSGTFLFDVTAEAIDHRGDADRAERLAVEAVERVDRAVILTADDSALASRVAARVSSADASVLWFSEEPASPAKLGLLRIATVPEAVGRSVGKWLRAAGVDDVAMAEAADDRSSRILNALTASLNRRTQRVHPPSALRTDPAVLVAVARTVSADDVRLDARDAAARTVILIPDCANPTNWRSARVLARHLRVRVICRGADVPAHAAAGEPVSERLRGQQRAAPDIAARHAYDALVGWTSAVTPLDPAEDQRAREFNSAAREIQFIGRWVDIGFDRLGELQSTERTVLFYNERGEVTLSAAPAS